MASKTGWCRKAGKISFHTELDAKIALSRRIWNEAGEKRYYECGRHFHLTSWTEEEFNAKATAAS